MKCGEPREAGELKHEVIRAIVLQDSPYLQQALVPRW